MVTDGRRWPQWTSPPPAREPVAPPGPSELSDEDLEQVAGGRYLQSSADRRADRGTAPAGLVRLAGMS